MHGEIKAVRFTGLNGNVRGGFVECASRLKCGVLVYRNADSIVI